MLAYLRYLAINLVYQDADSVPSHEFLNLLTSEHLETFQAAFSSLNPTLNEIEDGEIVSEQDRDGHDNTKIVVCDDTPPSSKQSAINEEPALQRSTFESATGMTFEPNASSSQQPTTTQSTKHQVNYDSPSRSDEGYGSYSGESYTDRNHDHEHDETSDEIAALGIIEEDDEVPDYGVALQPAAYNSISPVRTKTARQKSQPSPGTADVSPGASPTRARLAELRGQTPRAQRVVSSRSVMSENARNLLSIGYTLSLMGEKIDRTRSIEGSVKSVIIKASQTIEKSQAGSVYGKSRYGGSKFGGSRYAGSKFGGSKRSVARSIVLEENLPSWGF